MQEKPPISENAILTCLRADFGLASGSLEFLPLGADLNTAVFQAEAGGNAWFVKLRSGVFEETSVNLPLFLHRQGIRQILAPRVAKSGKPWADLGNCKVMVYPFIQGQDGYAVKLSPAQWAEFGAALKQIHTCLLPPELRGRIQREHFPTQARQTVREYLQRLKTDDEHEFPVPLEEIAAQTAQFLRQHSRVVVELVERAERGAIALQALTYIVGELPVLCHTDLHPGNLLITPQGDFYIVDWDEPRLALKERDLMFIGGGMGFAETAASEETEFFYCGYGETHLNPNALAYYRCQRILEDIAIFCRQLLGSSAGGADRAQWLRWLKSNFDAGGTIEAALRD